MINETNGIGNSTMVDFRSMLLKYQITDFKTLNKKISYEHRDLNGCSHTKYRITD